MARPFLELVHPEYLQPTLDEMQNLRTGNETINFVNRFRCKDGFYKYLSWYSIEYDDIIYASALDITEIKEQEAQLKDYSKKLEINNRELQDFAYIASHDLQEPLRKIIAFGDLLHSLYEHELDEQGRDYLNRMQNAAIRMRTLINDLLSYSRVSTKTRPFEQINLNSVIDEILSDLEVSIAETGAQIEIGLLPEIVADELQMRQLF
ncbi:hypothetical protein JW960_02905 [candidate division KSB1 bacterium]|nr:hypothetical protein [candidate division KSB1 bacterium]